MEGKTGSRMGVVPSVGNFLNLLFLLEIFYRVSSIYLGRFQPRNHCSHGATALQGK